LLSAPSDPQARVVSRPSVSGPASKHAAPHRSPTLGRRVVAEAVGTALLLATVVGSGIMAERLAGGNVAVALLANTLATAGGLVALILTFGGISGAHFNPAVTVADASQGGLAWRDVAPYIVAQLVGAFAGVALAHMMFGERLFSASTHVRAGISQLTAEFVATFGLLSVIWGCSRSRPAATPFAVAAYITAAYWFTSSTSFANPAVTLARAASDTFAGIRPADAPGFVAAQALGAASATLLFRWLAPNLPAVADRVISPTNEEDAA
jgi:glycerol uptake facilitator-like aquaporin